MGVAPRILLMDEPFGALDPLTRAELHAEFRRIQDRLRKTVIIVTHDMGEAFALADRVGVLDDGHLIACDRANQVAAARDPRVRRLLDAVPVVPGRAVADGQVSGSSSSETAPPTDPAALMRYSQSR